MATTFLYGTVRWYWLWLLLATRTIVATTTTATSAGNSTTTLSWKDWVLHYGELHGQRRPALRHDVAWLTLNVTTGFPLQLWARSHHCWKVYTDLTVQCPIVFVTEAPARATTTILVNTTATTDLKFTRQLPQGVSEDLCSCLRSSSLFSKAADVAQPSSTSCSDISNAFNLDKDVPESLENGEVAQAPPVEEKKKPRLRSLDTFRGLSLVVMIFVNYGGGGYWFFEHPPWNGLTVADLVFPWFIFIMGTSMTFSFRGMFRRQMTARDIIVKIIIRSIKLFALGIVLSSHVGPVDLSRLRIPGVLQRFALTYLVAAHVHLCCYRKQDSHQDRRWAAARDVILYLPEWLVHLALLAAYLGLTYGLPVPGCPTGYTGPGGLSEGGKYGNCTGGAARYIDSLVLGDNHLFQYPTAQVVYQTTVPYDPEGILGTLSTIFLCFLGIQSGRILAIYQEHKGRVIRWLVWAVVTGATAAVLCKCSGEGGWIPLNKNLWSLSFVLTTACFAFVLLTVLYVIIDVMDWWGGQPFTFPGMNSIVVYFCHSIFWNVLPINWDVDLQHWKMLLQDVWGAAFWVIVAYILFRKKIFVAL